MSKKIKINRVLELHNEKRGRPEDSLIEVIRTDVGLLYLAKRTIKETLNRPEVLWWAYKKGSNVIMLWIRKEGIYKNSFPKEL